MKRFAVVFVPEDNDPQVEILSAENWREATIQHGDCPWTALAEPEVPDDEDGTGDNIPDEAFVMPEDYDTAQYDAVNSFALLFAYKEIH